jgi:DNA polymerase-4
MKIPSWSTAVPDSTATRKIIHVDCDCFYAAVEVRDNPRLRHRPVAVGGDPGRRGVIATCNYEARSYGVHSAMPSARAMGLCPELEILRPDFDKYRRVSRQIQDIFLRYTELIEPLSLDEAFLDVTACEQFNNRATRIAQHIRRSVKDEVGITVSAGVAPNKFLAKIASDWRKPDGQFVITPDQVADFIATLPVEKIFGVGKKTAEKMHQQGLRRCHDLQRLSRVELGQLFGSFGERLWHLCRGIDERPVQSSRRRKSVSVENTYHEDLASLGEWQAKLATLTESLKRRMERLDSGYLVSALFVKARFNDFTTATCETPGDGVDEQVLANLLESLWKRRPEPARLLGIGVRLRDAGNPAQADMFPEERLAALQSRRKA